MNLSASGAFVARMALASHSIRRPTRTGSKPTSSDSVKGAEYQNPAFASSGLPEKQASTHSLRCPGLRGIVLGGGVNFPTFGPATRRGLPDQPPHRIAPESPRK